jgi:hypothetical protein
MVHRQRNRPASTIPQLKPSSFSISTNTKAIEASSLKTLHLWQMVLGPFVWKDLMDFVKRTVSKSYRTHISWDGSQGKRSRRAISHWHIWGLAKNSLLSCIPLGKIQKNHQSHQAAKEWRERNRMNQVLIGKNLFLMENQTLLMSVTSDGSKLVSFLIMLFSK